jgi:hypothetical protein
VIQVMVGQGHPIIHYKYIYINKYLTAPNIGLIMINK